MVLIQLNVVQEHHDVFECSSTYCEDILVVRYMIVWNALSGVGMALAYFEVRILTLRRAV